MWRRYWSISVGFNVTDRHFEAIVRSVTPPSEYGINRVEASKPEKRVPGIED